MCGIAGIISPNTANINKQVLLQMANTLQHRGPNGKGFYTNAANTIGFAHTRLSIIDLHQRASQPMHYMHYVLVYNGEIYNYKALKEQLIAKGYSFITETDSEIIPAAYDCWGVECLNMFDGMFAFALYNTTSSEILLARDCFGEKPLYYSLDTGNDFCFHFASEIKALWAAGIKKQISNSMLIAFISNGLTQNPANKSQTFYSNIQSLPPGTAMVINAANFSVQSSKWYKLTNTPFTGTEQQASEELIMLLQQSVQQRLQADVAIGTSLSGGIDSGGIAAIINALSSSNNFTYKTFTASFPGFIADETENAKAIMHYLNKENKWQQYFTQAANLDNDFEQLFATHEQPFQSLSIYAQYKVYQLAKQQGVTVVLDGQGADELFAGYHQYYNWYYQQLYKAGGNYKAEISKAKNTGLPISFGLKQKAAVYLPALSRKLLKTKAIKNATTHSYLNAQFVTENIDSSNFEKQYFNTLNQKLVYDSFTLGLEDLLRFADSNSMANSIEVRLPYLSRHITAFAFNLPEHFKIKNGFTKWVLRNSLTGSLPQHIVWNPIKTGYEPPQRQWLQSAKMQDLLHQSRQKLVKENIAHISLLKKPIEFNDAHNANNLDWRMLCAAQYL
jgi:asparagine synthase (glutamine-hydrolysing)